MNTKINKTIRLFTNWFLLLTSPVWVMPTLLYCIIIDEIFIDLFIEGKKFLF